MAAKPLQQWALDINGLHDRFEQSDKSKQLEDEFLRAVHEFLRSHSNNVYEDVLNLLDLISERKFRRMATTGIHYKVIAELNKLDKAGQFRNSRLTDETVVRALKFATSKKIKSWIELIFDAYRVNQLNKKVILETVNSLLDSKQYHEASMIIVKLNCQKEFDVEKILVPLLLQDKVNVLEDYIRECPHSAAAFISYLDNTSRDLDRLRIIFDEVPDGRIEKIDKKALNKLMTRLVKQYKIDLSSCPHLSSAKAIQSVRYLLYKRFVEKTLMGINFEEMLEREVGDNPEVQEELLYSLIGYNDTPTAYKFAVIYNVPKERWPGQVLDYNPNQEASSSAPLTDCDWDPEPSSSVDKFVKLPEELRKGISLIDTPLQLVQMCDHISQNHDVIGIDCEWAPLTNAMAGEREKLSIIQIATKDAIHIVDALGLAKHGDLWDVFASKIINSSSLLKLGFGFQSDLKVLKHALHGKAILAPEQILDLYPFLNWLVPNVRGFVDDADSQRATELNLKGLSRLVHLFLGKELDKNCQFSNWEKRPLRTEQIEYAALDAYVLIQIFDAIKLKSAKLNVNLDEKVKSFLSGKIVMPSTSKPNVQAKDEHDEIKFSSTPIRQFKCVVDRMLQGLGKNLRIVGADTKILEPTSDPDLAIHLAIKESRVVLTGGHPYDRVRGLVPPGKCWRAPQDGTTAFEQLLKVIERFNLEVHPDDLFSRCCKCNSNTFEKMDSARVEALFKNNSVGPQSLGNGTLIKFEGLDLTVFKRVTVFFVCIDCGQVYWDGCHQDRYRKKVQGVLFEGRKFEEKEKVYGVDKVEPIEVDPDPIGKRFVDTSATPADALPKVEPTFKFDDDEDFDDDDDFEDDW